jgi:hypothetical protein
LEIKNVLFFTKCKEAEVGKGYRRKTLGAQWMACVVRRTVLTEDGNVPFTSLLVTCGSSGMPGFFFLGYKSVTNGNSAVLFATGDNSH